MTRARHFLVKLDKASREFEEEHDRVRTSLGRMPDKKKKKTKPEPAAPKAKAKKSGTTEFSALDEAAQALESSESGSGASDESGPGSDSEGSSEHGNAAQKRAARSAKAVQARARQLGMRPGPLLSAMKLETRSDWPYKGTPTSKRVAQRWLVEASRSGRLRDYSEAWRRSIGAFRHKQLAVHTTLCEALDQLVLYDGLDVVNSAGAEVLVRHCLALELAFEEVETEADWKQKETSLVRWEELEDWDVVRAHSRAAAVSGEAAEEVRKNRERRHKADVARQRASEREARRAR